MSNIFILTDEGVVLDVVNEIPWALILLMLVFVLKENNNVLNIFILADEGVVVEVGNEIPWDPDTACVSICFKGEQQCV